MTAARTVPDAPGVPDTPDESGVPDARERLRDELLAWGHPRPVVDHGLAVELRTRLDQQIAALGEEVVEAAATSTGRRQLVITKTRLDRLVCDGLQADPAPFVYRRPIVRGEVAHKAIEHDLDARARGHEPPAVEVAVARAWQQLAAWKPGDPGSISAWLNACPPEEADELRADLVGLVTTFREVWPELPGDVVDVSTERRMDVVLAGGRMRLYGKLDLLVDSRRRDDRARALVVDFKTGIARSAHDRAEVRFYALLAALATGRLPFRWATFYVTEGRPEAEDLDQPTLDAVVRRIVDGVRQAARLVAVRDGLQAPRLQGGMWCRNCTRREDCGEADAARERWLADRRDEGEDEATPPW